MAQTSKSRRQAPAVPAVNSRPMARRKEMTQETSPSRQRQGCIRMFCFPPSGASGQMYALWRNQIPQSIELVGIDYPGRASRSAEAPIVHLETLAETLAAALLPDTDGPFALLGQSMGGLVAFEVAHWLAQRNRSPLHLFVCACRPPGQNVQSLIHMLPDDAFAAELDRRVGRQRRNDMGNSLTLLRVDITAAERYWAPPERCIACPISVIGGLDDGLHSRSTLAQWCNRTTGRFSLQFVPGGHFFRGHLDRVASVISAELDRSIADQSAT